MDPSASPLSALQITELLAPAVGLGRGCSVRTRDNVMLVAGNEQEKETPSECARLGTTTRGSVCFVFLTTHQRQAELETPTPAGVGQSVSERKSSLQALSPTAVISQREKLRL